jgi:hypothetical protein
MTTNLFTTHQQSITELCNKAEELLFIKDDSDNIICRVGHHMKLFNYFTFLLGSSSYCRHNYRRKGGCVNFK